MTGDATLHILMYFILPIWLLAGIADWLCHRASHIESTAGAKESIIHLIMFAEVGLPMLAAIFLQVNALVIGVMIAAFLLHEATALWDVSYAVSVRDVTPIEQHVHSFLEMIPLMAILSLIALHWGQFLAVFGLGPENADWRVTWKEVPIPTAYIFGLLAAILFLELLPYVEEFLRGLRANRGALVPDRVRSVPDE